MTARLLRALRHDKSGVAFIEFAYALPVLLILGFMGTEVANLAITNMRLSQISLTAADNASRLGDDSLSVRQLREQDIVDVFEAARMQARGNDIFGRGRMMISSVQRNSQGKQTIAWQRCRGLKAVAESRYGREGSVQPNPNLPLQKIRDTGRNIMAGTDGAVILVENYYDYEPVANMPFANIGAKAMSSTAVFTVRDRRDLTAIFNPNNAQVYRCDQFTR